MKGMQTARILILDDQPEEVIPLVRVLGNKGLGAIYVAGDRQDELPDIPFKGIRLAFVDMDLGSGSTEVRPTVTNTVGVLQRLIEPVSGPLVLVAWTKHGEYVEEFGNIFREQFPHIIALIVDGIDKPTKNEAEDPEYRLRLFSEIDKRIQSLTPANLMWEWEQTIHDAASATTAAIATIAASPAPDMDTESQNIEHFASNTRDVLSVLAHGVRGSAIGDEGHVLNGIIEGLVPVLSDHATSRQAAETFSQEACKSVYARVGEKVANKSLTLLDPNQYAQLNRVLLLAPPSKKTTELSYLPGDIYLREQWAAAELELDGMSKEEYLSSLKLFSECDKKTKDAALAATKRFLLEITPVCDHAQGKTGVCRLLRGVMVPVMDGLKKKIPSDDYLVTFEAVLITDDDRKTGFRIKEIQPIRIVIDLKYVVGASPSILQKIPAACRLRMEPLQTVVARFGAHAARAPYLSVKH